MKFKECMITWNPHEDVKIVKWPDTAKEASAYRMSVGACFTETAALTDEEVNTQIMIEFHTLVTRDGITPQKAHEAFLAIDEYRELIAPELLPKDYR